MNQTNFSEQYKDWPTDHLLDVLEHPDDYQSAAVTAARVEVEGRNLSEEQLLAAKRQQQIRKADDDRQHRTVRTIEKSLQSLRELMMPILNPFQSEPPTPELYIRRIAVFLFAWSFYTFNKSFPSVQEILSPGWWVGGFFSVSYLLSFLIVPTVAFLLWFRNKAGWFLTIFVLCSIAINNLPLIVLGLKHQLVGFETIDKYFPFIPPAIYTARFLLFVWLIVVLMKDEVAAVFKIGRQLKWITLILALGREVLFRWWLL